MKYAYTPRRMGTLQNIEKNVSKNVEQWEILLRDGGYLKW
jgi:hypothetical protein